jgi:hypothetical protein
MEDMKQDSVLRQCVSSVFYTFEILSIQVPVRTTGPRSNVSSEARSPTPSILLQLSNPGKVIQCLGISQGILVLDRLVVDHLFHRQFHLFHVQGVGDVRRPG